jgi:hypothetical protein
MKKLSSVLFFVVLALLYSCVEDTSLSQEELNLTTPTNERLASSVSALKKRTAEIVADKFGGPRSFRITSITYLDVSSGYVAQINFTVGDINSHYFIQKIPASPDGRLGCTEWTISCSGNSCCTPTFNPDTSQSSCNCSSGNNSGCTLNAKCVTQE